MMEDFNIKWDKILLEKINQYETRLTGDSEQDNVILIEGDTGSGKSNTAVALAYEMAKRTGREFNISHIYFDADKLLDFAKRTREQIIIWDEPVYAGLKREWWSKTQINLIKLLYTSRIKRHFLIFNIVKFSEFSPKIIERSIGMIRVYQRDLSKSERRFLYFRQVGITKLLDLWNRKKIRMYNKCFSFRGTLPPYVLDKIIDKEAYDKMKEDSILTIGEDGKELKGSHKLLKLQYGIAQFQQEEKVDRYKLANYLGIDHKTLSKWLKITEKHPIPLGNEGNIADSPTFIINKRDMEENNFPEPNCSA